MKMRQQLLLSIQALAFFAIAIYAESTAEYYDYTNSFDTSTTNVQTDSTETVLNIDKLREQLPAGFIDIIPDQYKNKIAIISKKAVEAKKMFKEKCKNQTGNDRAYERVEVAAQQLINCTSGLIDIEMLQEEIKQAPIGELDTVFNKYCRKRNIAIECVENFTRDVETCLEQKEIDGQKTFVKIFKNILNFICYKDGDHIALFIAEKGPECFQQQNSALVQCLNNTFFNYLPSEKELNTTELPKLPQLVMGVDQCNDMNRLQICVVEALENCEESTPANLVESMLKYVQNEIPCVNLTKPIQSKN